MVPNICRPKIQTKTVNSSIRLITLLQKSTAYFKICNLGCIGKLNFLTKFFTPDTK